MKAFQRKSYWFIMFVELKIRFLSCKAILRKRVFLYAFGSCQPKCFMVDVYVKCRDGDFFAFKEVSLLDQGSQAHEWIQQVEGVRYTWSITGIKF